MNGQNRKAIRIYVIYALLGFASSSFMVFAAVTYTPFESDKVLTAQDMNLRMDELASQIDQLQAQVNNPIRKLAVASGNGPIVTSTDSILPGRTVQINKQLDTTKLRLSYSDALGSNDAGDCHWEFQIDGNSCSAPALFYVGHNSGNMEPQSTIVAYCDATAGLHAISIHMWGPTIACTTNFGSGAWTMEAEEISPN